MICYRDMSFCANSDDCPVRDGCPHYFSPEEQAKATKWWGSTDYPVAFMAMAETCKRRKDKQNAANR